MMTTHKTKPRRACASPRLLLSDATATHSQSEEVLTTLRAARAEVRFAANVRQTRVAERLSRTQAANDAVEAYMRASGTTNYRAAFLHIQETRPELFADRRDPVHLVAANFNPNQDRLGRVTTSDGAVAPHGRGHRSGLGSHLSGPGRHREHEEPLAQRRGGDAKGQTKIPEGKKYDGKITAGAYKQKIATGHCLPAAMREAIAELSQLQTDAERQRLLAAGATPSRDGALQMPLRTLEQSIRNENPQYSYDFDGKAGPDIEDGRSTLAACGVASQRITIPEIQSHLEDGLVLVAAKDSDNPHAELITGMNKDGSYVVYNPLIPGGEGTLEAKNIIVRGFPRVYALKPQ